jgi:hypothetical protein
LIGNRALGRHIQTKLKISEPHDAPYEQEADRVADQVMSSRTNDGELQTTPETANNGGGGQSLPASVRDFFEQRFGYDFGQVRIHNDPVAVDNARNLNALAYTTGRDIVFAEGQYAPATLAGRRLLAHELTHVVQQGRGAAPDTVQRQPAPDYYDPHTKDPKRGFRPEDLARLTAAGTPLTFTGNLSPLSADLQKLLLENITATVRFALDPKDPGRIAELQVLRDFLAEHPGKGPFFDKPAERLDFTDLYHGHICVPRPILENKAELKKLGKAVTDKEWAMKLAIEKEIGLGTPTSRGEAKKVIDVLDKDRQPYLEALALLLQALTKVPEAGVNYHSRELSQSKPVIEGKAVDVSQHPGRSIFTPFSDHTPKFQLTADPHCETLGNFTFHVDQQGRVMLLPGASYVEARAYEILNDALVPTTRPDAETSAATQTPAPTEQRWSISAASGGDVTPDAQRLAFALGGRVSIRADEAVVFNPAIGFNLIYLPSSSFNASHLLAATADVTARIQQPLSGFYFDVSAGGYAGFDIDPKRETTVEGTGGLTGAVGAGWRWQHFDLGAETRALVPEAEFDRTNVLVFGRASWRFDEVKKPKRKD